MLLGRPLLQRICILLALALGWTAAASETEWTYAAFKGKSAPIVDGSLDDPSWEEIETEPLLRDLESGALREGDADFEAEFKAIWRDGSLYVAVKIRDDQRISNQSEPMLSDRFVLEMPQSDGQTKRFRAPLFQIQAVDNPTTFFGEWSSDGSVLEFSLETNAMFSADAQLRLNMYYIDVDAGESDRTIGWANRLNSGDPQFGTIHFQRGPASANTLSTTWGGVKTLY